MKVPVTAGTQPQQVLFHGFATLGVRFDVVNLEPDRATAPRRGTTPTLLLEDLLLLSPGRVAIVGPESRSLVLVLGFEMVDQAGEEYLSILGSGRRELF